MKYHARRTSVLAFLISGWVLWLWTAQHRQASHRPDNARVHSCDPPPMPKDTARLSQYLFPIPKRSHPEWRTTEENHRALRALFECLDSSTCRPNQGKVVITWSSHFNDHLVGHTQGEHVWAKSMVMSLRSLGYTLLYARSKEQMVQLYQMFPDLVKTVVISSDWPLACWEDETGCILSEKNPDGIPAWKIFTFHFWAHELNPLGPKWTLVPENYSSDFTYIGYSVEPNCLAQPFVPASERDNAAFIQAKLYNLFLPSWERAWPRDFFDAVSERTGVQFYYGAIPRPGDPEGIDYHLPERAINLGRLSPPVFAGTLSRMKVLVGVGHPATSPSAYDALCLGVPWINPIQAWDPNDPTDRTKWFTQHNPLKVLDPPYVYNVVREDREGFVKAVEDALSHPIERYVLDRMKLASVEQRVHDWMKTDWHAEAASLLVRRRETGEGPLFLL